MNRGTTSSYRLAVVAPNPVQYQVPLWKELARDPEITLSVFFSSDLGTTSRQTKGSQAGWTWDIPLTEGYPHEFLSSVKLPFFPALGGDDFAPALFGKLLRGEYDAILVQGYRRPCDLVGIAAALLSGTPLFMRVESHGKKGRLSWKGLLRRGLLRALAKRISMVLAIGTWSRNYWRSLGVEEARILDAPYAVDNEAFQAILAKNPTRGRALRRQWGVREGERVFLFVGRLAEVKAPEVLLQAFAALPPGHHLVFAGNGPLEGSLRVRVARERLQRVYFAGFINQSELPFYYDACDVLVLPSLGETWGLVVNEAMACGKPAIVTETTGCGPDLVAGPQAGKVVPPGQAAPLSAAMSELLDDTVWSQCAQAAAGVTEAFTFRRSARAIREALYRVTAKDRREAPTSERGIS